MLIKLSALLTIIPILNVLGERIPSISYISEEQIRYIGGSVLLQCSLIINDAKYYNIAWGKIGYDSDDLLHISVGNNVVLRDPRFVSYYNASSSKYTLQILDLQEKDSGTYRCIILLSVVNKITADVNLKVRRLPTILDNSTHSLVASEGTSVQMECYEAGYPTPTITWRRMNSDILPTGGATFTGNILKIESVRKEDRDIYYCVADNGVSNGDRRYINLEVEFAPVITVLRPSVSQALHHDMDLKCHVEAYPPPNIVWIKEKTYLSTNQHYIISNFVISDVLTETTLRVITIEKPLYGDYYCRSTNKLGSTENKISLYETSVPICPPACSVLNTASNLKSIYTKMICFSSTFIKILPIHILFQMYCKKL